MKIFISIILFLIVSCGKKAETGGGSKPISGTPQITGSQVLVGTHSFLEAASLATEIVDKMGNGISDAKKLDQSLDIFCIENNCTIKTKEKL